MMQIVKDDERVELKFEPIALKKEFFRILTELMPRFTDARENLEIVERELVMITPTTVDRFDRVIARLKDIYPEYSPIEKRINTYVDKYEAIGVDVGLLMGCIEFIMEHVNQIDPVAGEDWKPHIESMLRNLRRLEMWNAEWNISGKHA
jgi:hypothetical protein